jgi:hemoglobin-like flavoprotein
MDLGVSVRQVLSAKDVFGEVFYEEFFRRCPEAKPHFGGTDMGRQALHVTMVLTVIQQYHNGGYPAVEKYLQHLGGQHRRRGIPMDLYPHFRSAMLSTLARFLGDDWDRELKSQWSLALDKTVRVMLHGYEKPESI